ncbi:MAG: DUF4337 family protein [Spirochaetes bacterium]|nr:DUF4337 family protein [Spirochaetota bacterium]
MEDDKKGGGKLELMTGLLIALFAAILALNDLGAGHFGDDENQAITEKGNAYSWFQSKSVKQSLLKGQRDLIKELMDGGAVQKTPAMEASLRKMEDDIVRYGAEMAAIKDGYASATNSKAYLKLDEKRKSDFDKEFAPVVAAKTLEHKAEVLGNAGDRFDLGTLFLQLSLVLGAISLVIGKEKFKFGFFFAMVAMGLVGLGFSLAAYSMALPLL